MMHMHPAALAIVVALALAPGGQQNGERPATRPAATSQPADLRDPREVHLKNIQQITFGGENAEAYWSFGGDRLIMQSKTPPYLCDQIFVHTIRGGKDMGKPQLVSTGKGRCTCSYFLLGDQALLLAS